MTIDCGCETGLTFTTDGMNYAVRYCSLHSTASDLLEACKDMIAIIETDTSMGRLYVDKINAIIAKAEEREP